MQCVLLALGDGALRTRWTKELQGEGVQVECVSRGDEVVPMLLSTPQDALILSLPLPALDGLAVLDALSKASLLRYPFVLLVQTMGMSQHAQQQGADHCADAIPDLLFLKNWLQTLRNPTLLSRLALQAADRKMDTCRALVASLGISVRLKGFETLARAIALCSVSDRLSGQRMKGLYPLLGSEFGQLPSAVDRAMRHAIESAFTHGDLDALTQRFGNTLNPERGKPTNGECIAMLVQALDA